MSRDWTENQRLAFESRDGSILVSAAAGSGKSSVLVERIIKRITDTENRTSIDRLLVVTFTKAATKELKEKIEKSLNKLIEEDPQNPWYRRQLLRLPLANISTVDSFCGNIVREFSSSIGVSADYRLADESELKILMGDAVKETLDDMYSRCDGVFLDLIETFSEEKEDRIIENYILKFHKFLCAHPFADSWLLEKEEYYTKVKDLMSSVWGKIVGEYVSSAIGYCYDLTLNSEFEIEKSIDEPVLYSKLKNLVDEDKSSLERIKAIVEIGTYDEIRDCINDFSLTQTRVPNQYTKHPVKEQVSFNRNAVKDTIKNLSKLFYNKEKDCLDDIEKLTPIVSKMFEVIRLFEDNYAKKKRNKSIADFSDVAHWALNILICRDEEGNYASSEIAKEVSNRFDEVMVDEYQDADEVQDTIYNSVSNEGKNLFLVGDVKQCVYGFRQAMPEIFLNRKNNLKLYDSKLKNYPAKVILERNFRSRKEVTGFINFVFSNIMSVETGGLEYNKEEALVAGAKYDETDEPCVELHLLDAELSEEKSYSIIEARYIAQLIHKMCKNTYVKEDGEKRLLRYSDFAIVMRKLKGFADDYVNELKRCGIPAVSSERPKFLTSMEILLATNFLKVIDNPLQDIPLVSVMMSPLYGFTPDDMAKIRGKKRKVPIYAALREYAQEGDKKAVAFLEDIDALRTLSVTQSADVFINSLYDRTHLPAICNAAFGKASEDNLRLLITYAENYEQGASKGISAFVDYITKLEAQNGDLPAAVDNENSDFNCVRIMSVHMSKGLEFPVCIVANTHRKFKNHNDDNVLLHSELGFASTLKDNVLGSIYSTFPRDALSFAINKSEISEELRILYVAMTRAKERLIMIASDKRMNKSVKNIATSLPDFSGVSPYLVRECKYLSDWLIICALLHKNADVLRKYAGLNDAHIPEKGEIGDLEVKIIEIDENSLLTAQSGEISSTIDYEDVDTDIKSILKERFKFKYQNTDLCNIPQKVTASELAHRDIEKNFDSVFRVPKFITDIPLSAAEKGTALHLFLEHCDYLKALDSVENEIERLESEHILTTQQANAVDRVRVDKFINSKIVSLVLNAKKFYREYKFTVNIPACLVNEEIEDSSKNVSVVLQGAVDLLIVDDDGIVVVDYKTDRVSCCDELSNRYKKQLELYKIAIEQIFEKPVKQSLIYSVYLSKIKEV